jgi:hypothetical protein
MFLSLHKYVAESFSIKLTGDNQPSTLYTNFQNWPYSLEMMLRIVLRRG